MTKLDDIYQDREFKSLEDIFSSDSLGLLDNVKAISKKTTSGGLLENQFIEINSFIDSHGRPPSKSSSDISEKVLSRRLISMKADKAMTKGLIAFDRHNLLTDVSNESNLPAENSNPKMERSTAGENESNALNEGVVVLNEGVNVLNDSGSTSNDSGISVSSNDAFSTSENEEDSPESEVLSFDSFDDIFDSDELGLFDDVQPDILISNNQNQSGSRAMQERYEDEDVASRFQCKDFYKFEATFESIYHAIQSGTFTKNTAVSPKSINVGGVFVLNGQLCYIADIYKAEARKDSRSQERLRLIFANGTESNMLTHSLATAQYKYDNSYQLMITDTDWVDAELAKNFGDGHHLTGVIYVAKLIKPPSNLTHYRNLHKIGFSTLTGAARTKNSIRDTAFLRQEVHIIAEWQVYDANARSVEGVLHAFFHNQRVKVSIKGEGDDVYNANEWFDVPLEQIQKAVNLVIAGEIKNYRVDGASGEVIPK